MARSSTNLPRSQNPARPRASLDGARDAVAQVFEKTQKPKKSAKPQMMRQYDLIERVRRYNPATSEALLNRAYVYAMKAHGEQKRASGDPYFSHPLEVAAILTDLKLDDATIAAALLHDVGKGSLIVWDRVTFVLLGAVSPRLRRKVAREGGWRWQRALWRLEHHAVLGAEKLALARSRSRVIDLVSRHKDTDPAGDVELSWLMAADGAC